MNVNFVAWIRCFLTEYRGKHPYQFALYSILMLWLAVLHVCLVSQCDIIPIFSIALVGLFLVLYFSIVWTIIESKLESGINKDFWDAWKKIKIILMAFFLFVIIGLVVYTWTVQDDEAASKCIATTVSILSLLVGGNITCQLVGSGNIINGSVNIIRYEPMRQSEKVIQDLRTNDEDIGADVEFDKAAFYPRKAKSYNNNLNIEENENL